MLLQLYHLIFGNSKAAAKGTWNWFLWIMLTLLNSSLNIFLSPSVSIKTFRCIARISSLTTTSQPNSSLSHLWWRSQEVIITLVSANLISHLASRFFSILGTGFNSAMDIDRLEYSVSWVASCSSKYKRSHLSTGQVGCLLSHSWIQAAQNACSHSGASRGSCENRFLHFLTSCFLINCHL